MHPDSHSWLRETAALLVDAMLLLDRQQRQLELHCDAETKEEYAALTKRYERFVRAADRKE